jgi:DNA-binding transcriptional ArsR family regulator
VQVPHLDWVVVGGLGLFGFAFAVNSSVHSYLVLAYAGSEKAAEDVGFYYAANALGRFFGTLLSGLLYQWGGLRAGPAGLTPGALCATLDVPGSTLSFHLKALEHAGLVTQERDGRHLIYRPAIDRMNALLDYLTAHCCEGAPSAACDLGPAASGSCC